MAAIAADKAGSVILVGNFSGSINFGGGLMTSAGASDVFVARFGPSGEHLWSQSFGDSDSQEASSIALSDEGTVLLGGSHQGTVDFGGGALTAAGSTDSFVAGFTSSGKHVWSQSFGDALQQTSVGVASTRPGRALLAGDFEGAIDLGGGTLASNGAVDIFVASFAIDGFIFADGFETGDLSGP